MADIIKLIDITNATMVSDGNSNGTGVLDAIMDTINLYLLDDYANNRISGTDFAKVRLGSIEHVLSQSITFSLQEKAIEADIALKEKELLIKDKELLIKDKELLIMDKEIALKQAQIDVQLKQLSVMEREMLLKEGMQPHEIALKVAQIALVVEQTESENKQNMLNGVLDKQIALLTAQTATETNQALDVAKATAVKTQQIASMLVEDTVKASQKTMIDQQKLTEVQQTSKAAYEVLHILPSQDAGIIAETAVKTSQKIMIDQQNLTEVQGTAKASYEVLTLLPSQNALITEQKETENAKQASMLVDDTVKQAQSTKDLLIKDAQTINYTNQALNTAAQTATEGSKKLLVERQTKGFDDDALQKLLKQSLDSWSVAYSVSTSANAIPDAIKVNPIDSIMKKAMDGLNVVNTVNPIGEL